MKYSLVLLFGTFFHFGLLGQINNQSPELSERLENLEHLEANTSKLKYELAELEEISAALIEEFNFYQAQTYMQMFGLPSHKKDKAEIVSHSALILQYSEKHEQALWVYHALLPIVENSNLGRSNDFRKDSSIKTGSAEQSDYFLTKVIDGKTMYKGFGYDRGHLAPSADFRWSKKALSESYLYSNITPQRPKLNRELWAELEGLLRQYVVKNGTPLLIVTGPIFHDDFQILEPSVNQLAIPSHFFKVVLDFENQKAIGFLLPNRACQNELEAYALTIDEIEKQAGLDFFTNLQDSLETILEARSDYHDLFPIENGDAKPIPITDLPRNSVNTTMVKSHIKSEFRVCGTVVKTYVSDNEHTFLTIDKQFPNQVLSVSIFKDNKVNFDYKPEYFLKDKKACFKGYISLYQGVPSMNLERQEDVIILD